MKVKIIKNAPTGSGASDISKYIGQIFEASDEDDSNSITVNFGDSYGKASVYKGEYEVIDEDYEKLLKEKEDKDYQAFSNLMDMIFELAEELHDKIDNNEGLTDVEFRFLDAMDEYVDSVVDEEDK